MSPQAVHITYLTNQDLPDNVKRTLPTAAQDIYREAFNAAWKDYRTPSEPDVGMTREETAHRLAWTTVKKHYIKRGPQWVSRQESHLYRRAARPS